MSKTKRTNPDRSEQSERLSYWHIAQKPLPILVMLLPLIIGYEAALFFAPEEAMVSPLAHEWLLRMFERAGIPAEVALYMGGPAIVLVLFIWHVLQRDRWAIRPLHPLLMYGESLLLAMPLIVMGQLISFHMLTANGHENGMPALGSAWEGLVISIGAGLYEELVFRMLLIALLHTVFVNLFDLKESTGSTLAVLLAAVGFALYHPLQIDGQFSPGRLIFYLLAGSFFGAIYMMRGFGVVVGVHAMYDAIVILVINPSVTNGGS
jgi:hypothetical protein